MAPLNPIEDGVGVPMSQLNERTQNQFFVWREFIWGGIAGAFGEGIMYPVDMIKTRIQSQAIISGSLAPKSIPQMVRTIGATDGLRGFYRGVTPALTGSFATGATYFGIIESTKKWIEKSHPELGGHWANFIAGAIGDTLGSFVYVPCEVIKQRMQVQGTRETWDSRVMKENVKSGTKMYGYYVGMFQAGCSIWKEQGPRGLLTGYWSTLARDVPFAGLTVTLYEALKDLSDFGKQRLLLNTDRHFNNSLEGLLLGGLAGGFSAYLTTPFDVIKTRLQVQGSVARYNGWLDAIWRIWKDEGAKGMFRGSVTRIIWYIPASALMFMAVEFFRDHFNGDDVHEVAKLSLDKTGSTMREVV